MYVKYISIKTNLSSCLVRMRWFSGNLQLWSTSQEWHAGRYTIWKKAWFAGIRIVGPLVEVLERAGPGWGAFDGDFQSCCFLPKEEGEGQRQASFFLIQSRSGRINKPRVNLLSKHLQLSPSIASSQISWKRWHCWLHSKAEFFLLPLELK